MLGAFCYGLSSFGSYVGLLHVWSPVWQLHGGMGLLGDPKGDWVVFSRGWSKQKMSQKQN